MPKVTTLFKVAAVLFFIAGGTALLAAAVSLRAPQGHFEVRPFAQAAFCAVMGFVFWIRGAKPRPVGG
jgi:hypothetical protein